MGNLSDPGDLKTLENLFACYSFKHRSFTPQLLLSVFAVELSSLVLIRFVARPGFKYPIFTYCAIFLLTVPQHCLIEVPVKGNPNVFIRLGGNLHS